MVTLLIVPILLAAPERPRGVKALRNAPIVYVNPDWCGGALLAGCRRPRAAEAVGG